MKKTTVYLEENQPDQLALLAVRLEVSESDIIRRAVAHFLRLHSTDGSIAEAMAEAQSIFDDAENVEQANIRQLLHWKHGRENNSIRGALRKIDAKLDRLLEENNQCAAITQPLLLP